MTPYIFDNSFLDRFWSFVDKKKPNECWTWKSSLRPDGYGLIGWYDRSIKKWRTIRAHKASLEISIGRLLTGVECVLHDCPNGDDRSCVNPKHLWIGTRKDNQEDMVRKDRQQRINGEDKWCAKTSELDVIAIRIEYKLRSHEFGIKTKLADKYGIALPTAMGILSGRKWKYLLPLTEDY